MQISSNAPTVDNKMASKEVKTNFTEKISQDEAQDIKNQMAEKSKKVMLDSVFTQADVSSASMDKSQQDYEEFQSFLKDIGYDGKPIAELSQDEASDLVSEDGFFGVDQTSKRIANFVIDGADGDEELLRAGRDGLIQGYKDAEEAWGSELPDISKQTMDKAMEMVDKTMSDLGFSILDEEA